MASLFEDQAAGLRKLFAGARGPEGVAFAGPGGACGSHARQVAGLARGLASAGKEVLVIDEHAGADSVAAAFGLRSRFDLLQAVSRDVPAARVLLNAEASIRLLPSARAARQYGRLGAMERRALADWLRRLHRSADFILAAAADRAGAEWSPLLPQPQRIVFAVSPDSQSITEVYARMKRLALQHDRRRFTIAIARAQSRAEGQTVFLNLRDVARRHLGAELELAGIALAGSDPGDIGRVMAESFLNPPRETVVSGLTAPARCLQGAAAAHPVV